MTAKKNIASDALQYAYQRYIGKNPEQVTAYEEEPANAEVAWKIYDLRTKAGLTQRQLAKLVGTTASVICRLEEADYEGHLLAILRRIAAAACRQHQSRQTRRHEIRHCTPTEHESSREKGSLPSHASSRASRSRSRRCARPTANTPRPAVRSMATTGVAYTVPDVGSSR